MTISIRSNVAALQARNQISKHTKSQETAMTHLASGSRLSSAKDDAAALHLSNRLISQSRGLDRVVQTIRSDALMMGGKSFLVKRATAHNWVAPQDSHKLTIESSLAQALDIQPQEILSIERGSRTGQTITANGA